MPIRLVSPEEEDIIAGAKLKSAAAFLTPVRSPPLSR